MARNRPFCRKAQPWVADALDSTMAKSEHSHDLQSEDIRYRGIDAQGDEVLAHDDETRRSVM